MLITNSTSFIRLVLSLVLSKHSNQKSTYYVIPYYVIHSFAVILILALSSCSRIDNILDVNPPQSGDVAGSGPDQVKFVAIGDTGKGNTGQLVVICF